MSYELLLIPPLAGIISQIIKLFLKSNNLKWNMRGLSAYSGMPSGHSAIVISLMTTAYLTQGLTSPIFALSFAFAFVVIRDAVGIRRYLGEHGKILNILVKDLNEDSLLDEKYPRLIERVGHTPMQVLIGSLIGFAFSLLCHWLIY